MGKNMSENAGSETGCRCTPEGKICYNCQLDLEHAFYLDCIRYGDGQGFGEIYFTIMPEDLDKGVQA